MGGFWGSIVIGVKVTTWVELQKMYKLLGYNHELNDIKDPDEKQDIHGKITIEKLLNLDDHPQKDEYNTYSGNFIPQLDREWGLSWEEDDLRNIPIAIMIYDSYAGDITMDIPLDYINKKLAELRELLPTAQAYMVHFHS